MAMPVVDAPVFASPRARRPDQDARRGAWAAPTGRFVSGVAALATVAAAAIGEVSLLGAALVVVVLAGADPALRWFAGDVPDVELLGILRIGLGLKFLAVLPRFAWRADARDYFVAGRSLVDDFLRLDFAVETGRNIPGTGSVRYLSGLVQVVTFQDEFSTFVVFALFGFVGTALFVRAFVVALPSADSARYALLLMCWPSVVYWPASTGKDALMMLGLGLTALSLARMLTGRWRVLTWFLVGVAIAAFVRPHVALIAMTAAVAAVVFHSPAGERRGLAGRSLVVAALAFAATLALDGVEAAFEIRELDLRGVGAALDLANLRSTQGGSSFVAARIDSFGDAPWGAATVLLRPFPHEAGSLPMLVSALEGVVLLGLLVMGIPRLVAAAGWIRREAYVGYCLVFSLVFVVLFSSLGNFGILVRQRTMLTPLLLVLVALPTARERVRSRRQEGERVSPGQVVPGRTDAVYRGDAGGSPVLFHPVERRLHVLNHSAAAVWDRLDRRETLEELTADLASTFGTSTAVVRPDVEHIISRFTADGLVGGEAPPGLCVPSPPRPDGPVATRVAALDAVIDVIIPGGSVADAVRDAVAELVTDADVDAWIHAVPTPGGGWRVTTSQGDEEWVGSAHGAVSRVIAEINRLAVAHTVDDLVLHAGAIVEDGRVALLPGSANRGKSTLTTALVRSGAAYLTDEAAAVGRDGACRAYPKPIALDPGSFRLFPELEPPAEGELGQRLIRREWHVAPSTVGSLGRGGTIHAIVCPHWCADSETVLTRLAPTDALHALLSDAFDFTAGGQEVFEILTRLVSEVPVYRIEYGDLADAVATVRRILSGGDPVG